MKKFLLGLLFLTSCSQIQGPYVEPIVESPTDWKNLTNQETPNLKEWWRIFNDPCLNELEEEGIRNNKNVHIAYQRMLQAFYQARFRLGALSPQIALAPTYFKQGSSVNGAGSAALVGNGLNGGNTQATDPAAIIPEPSRPTSKAKKRLVITDIDVPLNFNWELDLWGKLTQNYLNAYYNYESLGFDLLQMLNQITSDIAVNYFLLRGYDSEWEILNQIITSRKDNLEINQERYTAGLINFLDVTRAEVDYHAAKADRENVIRERELQVNILATLIGTPASELELVMHTLAQSLFPPHIPAGIPCEILETRPDVLSSRTKLKAFYASIGVAYAEFFPDLTLSGAVGYSSNKFNMLFDWQSRLWQMAASVMQIIYDGGRLQANLNQTVAAYAQSVSEYEETVLEAFREVEDALLNFKQHERQNDELIKTVTAAQDTYSLAKERYNSGLINYLDVVIAERDLLNSSRSAAVVHAQCFVDVCLLVKALGGGWEPTCDP